jgi:hypothetical protein
MTIRSDGGFEGMIASMRELAANGLSMQAAAGNVDVFMRGQLAKGQTPAGDTWKATKKGNKPLKGAANAYMQTVVGQSIVMKVMGRYAFHHFGAGDNPAREQLPTGAMPKELGNAIRAGLVDDFKAKTKVGKMGYRKFRAAGGKISRGTK